MAGLNSSGSFLDERNVSWRKAKPLLDPGLALFRCPLTEPGGELSMVFPPPNAVSHLLLQLCAVSTLAK
ncbi:hypothetical protein BHE74_00016699 [Ensete ventricosum]|uniref:Uncharacterized protein n=1 Tax=Ensete ventricosum TaxID=4639 RepID=A0A427A5L7_ENSVE|nr:hypothetical protein B296_00002627 [Ensete ventricosum]RWW19134.1 hypothetical protein GW17_00016826 [Ensete ventricosum]RWW75303.1 hypothetical protein BHE74_00016699 [Ensete ventricosum]RZR93794.1 hypothetical protein BHM03_00022370 [Ensete ventricosum]